MPQRRSQQTLLRATSLISSAERILTQAIGKTTDPTVISTLNREYSRLDLLLTRLLDAQSYSEEELQRTLPELKEQAATLQAQEGSLEATPEVITASTILGYYKQAVELIDSL